MRVLSVTLRRSLRRRELVEVPGGSRVRYHSLVAELSTVNDSKWRIYRYREFINFHPETCTYTGYFTLRRLVLLGTRKRTDGRDSEGERYTGYLLAYRRV